MKIACLSDLHGHLPEVPDCDLLLLGGDYCRNHNEPWWYEVTFKPWINALCRRMKVIGVAGNHDFIFEERLAPEMDWTYLEDKATVWRGLKIYGTPYQPVFFDWAFNRTEDRLEIIWSGIPDDTDILLLHGPPRGYGDFSNYGNVHTGSPSLLKRIQEVKPKLVVAGHIHPGYGKYMIGEETIFINASLVNEKYKPVNEIIVLDLPIGENNGTV